MSVHVDYFIRPTLAIMFLQMFFGMLRTNWPTSYYATTDVVAGSIAPSVLKYSAFRFGPVFVVIICALSGLQYQLSGRVFVAALSAIGHLALTVGRTALHPTDNLANRGSSILTNVSVTLGVAVSGALAVVVQPSAAAVLPDAATLVQSLVTAALVTTLGIYALRLTQRNGHSATDNSTLAAVEVIRHKVEQLAAEYEIDHRIALAIIATELQQRPGWIRALERAARWTGLVHTIGISQSLARAPRSIDEDLTAALEPLRGSNFRYVPADVRHYQALAYLEKHNDSETFLNFAFEAFIAFSRESEHCTHIGADGSPSVTCGPQTRSGEKWTLAGTISRDIEHLTVRASNHTQGSIPVEVSIMESDPRRTWKVEVPLQFPTIEVVAALNHYGTDNRDRTVHSRPTF